MIEITDNDIAVQEVIDSVRLPAAGALVSFIGTVRKEPEIDGLELESYKDMALDKLAELRQAAIDRFSVLDVSIVHRVGSMQIGENIVVIAVSAAHRRDAFEACRFLIDELKVTVPIWKKSVGPGTWEEGKVPKTGAGDKISGMVDISDKEIVKRTAVAEGYIDLTQTALDAVRLKNIKKGDVLEAAKLSAVSGVKQTPNIIPLCHPLPITAVEVEFEIQDHSIKVTCTVKADYRTGVEMEALTGVTCALLTVWDMTKYLEKDGDGQYPTTRIHGIRVLHKEKK